MCLKNKTKVLVLFLCFIMCYSIFTSNVSASISTQAQISSYGIVSLNSTSTLAIFGNTAIGNSIDQNDANVQSISYFTCATTGSVTDIIAYISGTMSGNAIAALYAISGNSAGTLLAQSTSINIGTALSWVDFLLSSPYTVNAGTTYGLAIMGNVPVRLAIVAGTGQRTGGPGDGSYSNGFANPFGTFWFNDLTGGMSIYAIGTSSSTITPTPIPTSNPTPTPMPTLNPSSANLEPLSAFYADMNGAASSYASLDYGTLHNGNPSIRTGADYVRWTREVDGEWIGVKPGDHIVMTCWVKTAAFTSSDIQAGATFGWDFYGSTSMGYAIAALDANGEQAGHPNSAELNPSGGPNAFGHTINGEGGLTQVSGLICRVPFNQDWTLIQWDFVVPTQPYHYAVNDASFPNTVAVDPFYITSMVPWFGGRNIYDTGYLWFSEPTLYINP
jgi:hypothetical protein